MERPFKQCFVGYQESMKLVNELKSIKNGSYADRQVIHRILSELSNVRSDVNYYPMRGHQCIFTPKEFKVFTDVYDSVFGVKHE